MKASIIKIEDNNKVKKVIKKDFGQESNSRTHGPLWNTKLTTRPIFFVEHYDFQRNMLLEFVII